MDACAPSESEAALSDVQVPQVLGVHVGQSEATVSVRVDCAAAPITLVASSAEGIDRDMPSAVADGGVRFVVDLTEFAGTAGPWTLRLRHRGRWLDWGGATWDLGVLTPYADSSGWAVVTAAGGAAPALSVATSPTHSGFFAASARAVATRRSGLRVDATVQLGPHGDAELSVLAVERATGESVRIPIEVTRQRPRHGPWRVRHVRAQIPWHALLTDAPSVWDVSIVATNHVGEFTRRLAAPPSAWRRTPRTARRHHRSQVWFLEPRYTYKARTLHVRVSALGEDAWSALRTSARTAWLTRVRRRSRPLWLIGELPSRAQDNGIALFRHVRHHHPEIDARYVISDDSPSRADVESLGPVVLHGTVAHARAVLVADRVVSTHHADYLFPLRTEWMRRQVKATLVFLQHGVLGAKWVADLYGVRSRTFATDLFLVSSPRERDIVVRDFGYRRDQVAVTGLPRFDSLLSGSAERTTVLVMPTWRPWLTDSSQVRGSEFAEAWGALLADARVRDALLGTEVVVVAHPNLAEVLTDLHLPSVRVAGADELLPDLLSKARMLITDYSSVGIDAAIAGRAVVYYQFDRPRFMGRGRAHVDLDADLPGEVAVTHQGAAGAVVAASERDFAITQEHAARARTFFPARDTGSSERVVAAVTAARRSRPSRTRALARRTMAAAAAALGRSRLRTPVVRAVYEAARLTRLRPTTALFEASFGRQYADSPLAIARELRRQHPEFRIVWSGTVAPEPPASSVGRLTVRYGWHLATAGTLVSNQSLPHWIRPRRRQLYLQTWHGTPFKRMLHDLDSITGRDAGYVHRATRGASRWGVLLSPNPHTTRAMASAFRHRARVLEVGYPRNDIFYAPDLPERTARLRDSLGIRAGAALVLHAPTFRDEGLDGNGVFVPTEAIDLRRFAETFGDRAVLVLRRHVLDRTPARIPPEAAHCVVDGTAVADVQDLLVAADVLVTDYSSVAFDFLNTRRPCVFFAPDLESYRDRVRGFYLDPAVDLPGPLVTDQDALMGALEESFTHGAIAGFDLEAFAQRYCPHDDGAAAKRVVATVFGAGA